MCQRKVNLDAFPEVHYGVHKASRLALAPTEFFPPDILTDCRDPAFETEDPELASRLNHCKIFLYNKSFTRVGWPDPVC